MKRRDNNRYWQFGINGLLVVCGGIIFYYLLFHAEKLSDLVKSALTIFTPIIAGALIAYILNPVLKFIEKNIILNIINKIRKKQIEDKKALKIVRIICTFITIILFLAVLYGIVMMVVPQIILNIQTIIQSIPIYVKNMQDFYNGFLKKYPDIANLLETYWDDISTWFNSKLLPQIETLISKTSTSLIGSIITVFKSVLNFILGIIIAIYLLIDKEKFYAQLKKIIYAFMKIDKANNFINNIRYSNKIFGGFLTGKVIDSIIIGIICYICMLFMRIPYPALISAIVGVTNVIPYFGPFIGAIPSAFIVLLVSPKKCILFLIFILILQQFDGNILGPKILGNTTGLSSFWVIFAITLFSGLFGLWGMFLGVPVFAVLYSAFRTFINERLAKKHLPNSTEFYQKSYYYRSGSGHNSEYDGNNFKFDKETFEGISPELCEIDDVNSNKSNE